MEEYMKARPKKTIFDSSKQDELREGAIEKIRSILLPNDSIIKILLIGSSIKGSFGKYDSPGFRGSLFSDFDFIVFVSDQYTIPPQLIREPEGRPFDNEELNLAYRIKSFLHGIYDAEIFFIRKSSMDDQKIQKLGESAGIPFSEKSKNPNIQIYP